MQKYMEKKYLKVDEEKLQREFSSQFCAQKKSFQISSGEPILYKNFSLKKD